MAGERATGRSEQTTAASRRIPVGRAVLLGLGAALGIWLVVGIHRIDTASEFGILDGPIPGLFPMRVERGVALAPPGLVRLTRCPKHEVEVALPAAGEARLRAKDASLFGFRGHVAVEVRDQEWRRMAKAAGGGDLSTIVTEAARDAGTALENATRGASLSPGLSHEFEAKLGEELEKRGVHLKDLSLQGVDYLTAAGGTAPGPAGTRLLVVGLDAADWEIIDPLIEQGRMPNLQRLVRDGVRAKLLTISPALSPVVWTSIATGVEPSRHGILDFLVADPSGKEGQPVTSAQRKAPAVWEILSAAGVKVGVVGWWATWPADPVNGYLVSDRIAYQLFGFRPDPGQSQGKTWPKEAYDEIRPLVESPTQVEWSRVVPFLSGARARPEDFDPEERKLLDDFRTLLASGDTYLAAALAMRKRESPSFETVYFEGTDTVGHLFMPYRPPRLAGVDPKRFESFQAVVDRYYEMMDRNLGRLLEGREKGWTIMVLSDHGFAVDATRPLTTDSRIGHGPAADWHRKFGILVLSGDHIRAGVRLDEAGVYDIAPTILALYGVPVPPSWPGHVLASAIEPAFFGEHPVLYAREDPKRAVPGPGEEGSIDPEAAELREKLRSLGYISGGKTETVRVTTRNNTAITLMGQGKNAEAEKILREGLAAEPDNPVLLINLGTALRLQKKYGEARAVLERVLPIPDTRRAAGFQLAQIALETSDLDAAEHYLREVLASEPGAAEVLNTLGLVLEKKKNLEGAEAAYRRAAELDADAAEPRTNLGNLARRRGKLEEAAAWYEKAIEADAYSMGAYNNLAMVYQDLGQMKKAIDLYEKALSKAPSNAVVLNNLGSLYYATGDTEQAGRLWRRAIAADASYASPLNNLAGIEIASGRLDEAEKLLRDALRLDPGYGDARLNRALIYGQRGLAAQERGEIEKAAEDPRSRVTALTQLGFLELDEGRPDRALDDLREASRFEPRNPQLFNGIGEALRRLGRADQAIAAWRTSLALDPNQPRIRDFVDTLARGQGERPASPPP